jgi:flagellar protein FliJ
MLEIAMRMQCHFGNGNEAALRETAQIRTMIADFERTLLVLDSEISTEEERAGMADPADAAYPNLAGVMRARRDNLKVTVSLLEQRLDQIKVALPEATATAA